MKQFHLIVLGVIVSLLTVRLFAQEAPLSSVEALPTAPYACDGTPPPREMAPYDGALPSAPITPIETLSVLHVPRLIESGYYAQVAQGIDIDSRLIGNVFLTTDAPNRADAALQKRVIDIYEGTYNGLIVAPAGSELAPVLSRLIESGIWVVAYDHDPGPQARSWYVEPVEANALAYTLAERLAAQLGGAGRFAVLSTEEQASWVAELEAYLAQCHPDLTWLETAVVESGSAADAAADLLARYGDDLDALVVLEWEAFAEAAQAVTEAQRCPLDAAEGAASDAEAVVQLVGVSTPNLMRPFMVSGCVAEIVMWDPQAVGAAALEALMAAMNGTLLPGADRLQTQQLGTLDVVGSVIKLGPPQVFTAEMIPDLDF
jgi:ABC-type sugar transport system substrate-binding protein